MKAASMVKRSIIVVGVVTMLLPLFIVISNAETISVHGAYYVNIYQENNTGPYFANVTIVTDNVNATGSITISSLGTFNYRGSLTYIDHLRLSGTSWGTGYQGTFIASINGEAEIVSLDSTQLTSLLNAINSINTTDSNILSAINYMKSDIMSVLNNIDNLIDTISWVNDNIQPLQYSTTFNGELVSLTGNTGVKTIYIPVSVAQSIRQTPTLYHYKMRVDSSVSGVNGDFSVVLSHVLSDGSRVVIPSNVIVYHNRQTIDIYIYDTYLYWQNFVIELTASDGSVHVYNTNTLFFQYIQDTDIEYWTIITALQNITEYQQQYIEIQDPNDDLSSSVDNYVQQEDNLISGFDSAISSSDVDPVTVSSSNPMNWGNGFIQSLGVIGYVFNTLTAAALGGNPVYMLLNFSLMLGLALLIIGKRS